MDRSVTTPFMRLWTIGAVAAVLIFVAIPTFSRGFPGGFELFIVAAMIWVAGSEIFAAVRITDNALLVRKWIAWKRIAWSDIAETQMIFAWPHYVETPFVILKSPDKAKGGFWVRHYQDYRSSLTLAGLTAPVYGFGMGTGKASRALQAATMDEIKFRMQPVK